MKAFLHIFHVIIWLMVVTATFTALTDRAYSQHIKKTETKFIYIDKVVFSEAIDRLVQHGEFANQVRYSIPEGFIECGISIYLEDDEIKLSNAFTGKAKSQVTLNYLAKKHPRVILPDQFFEAIPEDAQLIAALHTHPSFPGSLTPSDNDMMFSNQFDVPIFTVDQGGESYQFYYSYGQQRPSIGFLRENNLWHGNRKATTKAYRRYLKSHGRAFVSEELRLENESNSYETQAVVSFRYHPES